MKRGHDLRARRSLPTRGLMEVETSPGGFITSDDGMLECSPDRLIGDRGDLELKCPLIPSPN